MSADTEKEIQTIDFKTLSLEELVLSLEKLIQEKPISTSKDEANALRASFYLKYNEMVEAAKQAFLEEGGNEIDFEYNNPIQVSFKEQWKKYLEKKKAHYNQVAKDLSTNLSKREEIINAIKQLAEEGDVSNSYKALQQLMADWKEIGPIPSEKYQQTWGNYHLYVEKFYDLLHLNNDLRAIDFKHNLEVKQSLVNKAKELAKHSDVQFAFNELQVLHKIWKEETGPVAKEFRETIWQEFSEITNAIHDKRNLYFNALKEKEQKNYEAKLAKIQEIEKFDYAANKSFGDWKKSIDKFEKLKNDFVAIGKIPKAKTGEVWEQFKEATKGFNRAKNDFFKETKKVQSEALEQKRALIKEALEWKDSEDFLTATDKFKRIQADWKKVGFVPRKQADALWKEFKAICDAYFDNLNNIKKEGTPEEKANYENKVLFLEELKAKEITVADVKELTSNWLSIGSVPQQKNQIDQDIYQSIVKKLALPKKDEAADFVNYQLKTSYWASINSKKLYDEFNQLRKEKDTVTKDLKQLENNLGFFSGAKKGNALFDTVMESIEFEKKKLVSIQKKLKHLKTFE